MLAAVVALGGAALVLAVRQATPVVTPSQLASRHAAGGPVQLVGRVVPGSVRSRGPAVDFSLADVPGTSPVPVRYEGALPDGFGPGALVSVRGAYNRGVVVGEDSLSVSCGASARAGHC